MGIRRKRGLQGVRSQELLDLESDWWWKVRERKSFGLTPGSVLPTGLPFTELGAWEEGPVLGDEKVKFELLALSCGSYMRGCPEGRQL